MIDNPKNNLAPVRNSPKGNYVPTSQVDGGNFLHTQISKLTIGNTTVEYYDVPRKGRTLRLFKFWFIKAKRKMRV